MTQTKHHDVRAAVPALVRRAVTFEIGVWRSLYRWIARRPRVPDAEAEAFSYVGAVEPLIWAFIGVSAIEVPVAHLLLPWDSVRISVLVLGLWGLTWMFGLLASLKVYPHVVGGSGLRVRYGTTLDISVPWDIITSIRVQRRNLPSSRTVQLDTADTGTVLNVGVSSQTNVHVALREPMPVALPKGEETVTELRFYADDPDALVTKARAG